MKAYIQKTRVKEDNKIGFVISKRVLEPVITDAESSPLLERWRTIKLEELEELIKGSEMFKGIEKESIMHYFVTRKQFSQYARPNFHTDNFSYNMSFKKYARPFVLAADDNGKFADISANIFMMMFLHPLFDTNKTDKERETIYGLGTISKLEGASESTYRRMVEQSIGKYYNLINDAKDLTELTNTIENLCGDCNSYRSQNSVPFNSTRYFAELFNYPKYYVKYCSVSHDYVHVLLYTLTSLNIVNTDVRAKVLARLLKMMYLVVTSNQLFYSSDIIEQSEGFYLSIFSKQTVLWMVSRLLNLPVKCPYTGVMITPKTNLKYLYKKVNNLFGSLYYDIKTASNHEEYEQALRKYTFAFYRKKFGMRYGKDIDIPNISSTYMQKYVEKRKELIESSSNSKKSVDKSKKGSVGTQEEPELHNRMDNLIDFENKYIIWCIYENVYSGCSTLPMYNGETAGLLTSSELQHLKKCFNTAVISYFDLGGKHIDHHEPVISANIRDLTPELAYILRRVSFGRSLELAFDNLIDDIRLFQCTVEEIFDSRFEALRKKSDEALKNEEKLSDIVKGLTSYNKQAKEKIKDLEKKSRQLNTEKKALESELSKIRASNNISDSEIADLKNKVNNLSAQLKTTKASLGDAVERRQKAEKQLSSMTEQYNSLKNSQENSTSKTSEEQLILDTLSDEEKESVLNLDAWSRQQKVFIKLLTEQLSSQRITFYVGPLMSRRLDELEIKNWNVYSTEYMNVDRIYQSIRNSDYIVADTKFMGHKQFNAVRSRTSSANIPLIITSNSDLMSLLEVVYSRINK